tara:strand:- start:2822 stop:3361 length:540 start_codon:yes stop_codon:yes gene_type:complete
MSYRSDFPFLSILLGAGLIGTNFFSLTLLSKSTNSIPFDLARLNTTENSASQMHYQKNGEKLDLTITHNMHQPKTVLFSSDTTKSKWNGKQDVSYVRREYVPHVPTEKRQEIDMKCLEASIIGKNNGGLVGAGVATAAGASRLSNIPIIGFLLEPFARNRAQKIGSDIGSSLGKDLSDC